MGAESREYNEEGVDLTLIEEALMLTPAERVDELEALVNELEEIRAFVEKD